MRNNQAEVMTFIGSLKEQLEGDSSVNGLLGKLPEFYRLLPPTVYFITAFDDGFMETARTMFANNPVHRAVVVRHGEPEDRKYRIERQRDDGTILYYQDTRRFGGWTRNQKFAKVGDLDEMSKLHWYVEKAAGSPGYYSDSDSRTFGFYFNKDQAIAAVESNQSDMHEMLYTWIVIEPYNGWGIHPLSATMDGLDQGDESVWYKWEITNSSRENYDGRWVRAERPAETKHTVCFALG